MNKSKYFRTKLDKTLEKYLSQFEYWDEIQTKEVDLAFEAYLTGSYIPKIAPREVEKIFELIGQGGILGVAVEAHEKWEVLEYLKKGYMLEQIRDGTAHKAHKKAGAEFKDVSAHAEARFKEHKLYQFCYEKLFKEQPPALMAFLLVCPHQEIFIFDDIDIEEHLNYYMDRFMHEYGKHEVSVRAEKCSERDLEKALMFFEKNGYKYKDRQKALRMAIEYLQNGLKDL